jgi:hypothetical protein
MHTFVYRRAQAEPIQTPNKTKEHGLKKWSGAVSASQRTLLFILIQCPATASGAQFCLPYYQSELVPKSSTARGLQLTL